MTVPTIYKIADYSFTAVSITASIRWHISATCSGLTMSGGAMRRQWGANKNQSMTSPACTTCFLTTKSTYYGAALVNSNAGGLAKWGFTTLGTEMVMGSGLQTIPHGIATKINFGKIVWEQTT
jgi:hypothetical protein